MEYKGYTARVEFDSDAGVLFGEVEGLRDVVTFEATDVREVERAFRESVEDYLTMCASRGEEPEKPYSGKFLVRVDPRLHRDIAMAAARGGKSLNAFVTEAFRGWLDSRAARSSVATPSPMGENASAHESPNVRLFQTPVPERDVPNTEHEAAMVVPPNRTPGRTPSPVTNTPPVSRTPQSSVRAA